jgi:hypothetical protein
MPRIVNPWLRALPTAVAVCLVLIAATLLTYEVGY